MTVKPSLIKLSLIKLSLIKPIVVAVAMVAIVAIAATIGGIVAGQSRARPLAGQSASGAPDRFTPLRADVAAPNPSASSGGESGGVSPGCVTNSGWDCQQQARLTAAGAYLARRDGNLGAIVHDRTTGTVWQAGGIDYLNWTASTIKLGIAAVALEWNRAGKITLSNEDRANMRSALVDSSNDAATSLWDKYGGQSMFDRLRSVYGMSSLSVVPGYELFWRNLRCDTEDLHQMMLYILDRLNLEDRSYLTTQLRGVSTNQRWGVWAAGAGLRPGNKNGWAQKPDSAGSSRWVTHTVGFAGPSERYVVAVTYTVPLPGGLSEGVHVVSDLIATIFGSPVPATVNLP